MATYYEVGLNPRARPPLDGDRTVDAVVIGGGFAGVAAAKAFADDGMGVLLVERNAIGAAASGRNGGILLLSEGAHLGDSDGTEPVQSSLGRVASEIAAFLGEHGEDAELRRGTVRLATTRRQARKLATLVPTGLRPDGSPCLLAAGALGQYVRSNRYVAGLLEPDNLAVNPHKLLEHLARAAESAGTVIAEHTTVTEFRPAADGRTVVVTDQGTITTGRLVVATGARLGDLVPSARRTVVTVHSQIGVTEPIDPELLDRVVPSDLAFSEVITYARYFRRVAGNRLLFGISTVLRPVDEHDLATTISTQMTDTFPDLRGVGIEYSWSGVVGSTVEETPWMEHIGPTSVLTLSNGVLASWHAGGVAARATRSEVGAYGELASHRHRSWPPFHLPEALVRLGGGIVFAARDRL